MQLKKIKKSIATAAILGAVAFSNAHAAMVVTAGGIIDSIQGFQFQGQTYNIAFSSNIAYNDLPGKKFDSATGLSFITELGNWLNTSGSSAPFTGASTPSQLTYAMLPSTDTGGTDSGTYNHRLQHIGAASDAPFYKVQSYTGSYNWNIVDPSTSRADYTGMVVTAVPIPGAAYLMATGLIGFAMIRRRANQKAA